jgi:hypothetical protein
VALELRERCCFESNLQCFVYVCDRFDVELLGNSFKDLMLQYASKMSPFPLTQFPGISGRS